MVAGNETTRNAMTGGMLALLENPGEWQKLRANPALVDAAVEEIVRWTTPVIQFAPHRDRGLHAARAARSSEGQSVCLFYASANRDEDVFDDPFAFRIDREPERSHRLRPAASTSASARTSRASSCATPSRSCATRLEHCELAGPVERVRSSFVGGIKRAPMRWKIGTQLSPH